MKSKKNLFIITSILCLLPLILSAILYSRLPDQITVHWDNAGQPDSYMPKSLAAFGLPFLFLILHACVYFRLTNDPKRSAHSKVTEILNIWLIPCTSLIIMPITLFIAIGANIPIAIIVPVIVGIILIIIGNYLPKNRLNYTIGVRTPWSLNNADNWNKTNRLAGYLLILGGLVIIITSFIQLKGAIIAMFSLSFIILLALIPILYSFFLYKKTKKLH